MSVGRLVLVVVVTVGILGAGVVALVAGCGGSQPVLNLGNGFDIEPPVNLQAATPTFAKFGPVAAYLPPAGTKLTYRFSSLVYEDAAPRTRLEFLWYNNTAGSVGIRTTVMRPGEPDHRKAWIFWVKKIGGQSYIWKRRCTWLDPGSTFGPEVHVFSPGILIGLFSASPKRLNSTWTSTQNGVPESESPSIYQTYKGTRTVRVAGSKHTTQVCRMTFDQSFLAEVAGFEIYWLGGVGPVYGEVNPVAKLVNTSGAQIQVPRWAKLARVELEDVEYETPGHLAKGKID